MKFEIISKRIEKNKQTENNKNKDEHSKTWLSIALVVVEEEGVRTWPMVNPEGIRNLILELVSIDPLVYC